MAGGAAPELDLHAAEREVRLVVDDDDVAGGRSVLAGELRGSLAAEIHEGLRTSGEDVIAFDGSLSHACQPFAPLAAELAAPLELVKAHPADIVPGPRVFASRVAEADDQLGHADPASAVWRSGMSASGSRARVAAVMAAACSGSAWSCPRQWSKPWTASRRSSATPSVACAIARSTEIATSPTLAPSSAGNASTSVGASVPRNRALRSCSSASPVRRTDRLARGGAL